ncbi:hypothetical protein TREMEDRAFT_59985 [Tremella mesenterica DSM 1558]|uniref:uncharacterized protein n=1 Tax=Tremella mesenterica (strain ATCC 24925 / CBS 8224 / DSM 1558 / NBRC 9311 / NRRL Y-6157 / RJB 2259-6 / UBC 559-6) TaxID=578456 RepID=UPI0003F49620|nr:uncharacterized protein TREMEDRAFT_59985 [Tremella mesenterica DSM 1558]EIW71041.1 hypothetical protein TREMEDRAFT_59985 [Tremella mesenterica DSM 1558]
MAREVHPARQATPGRQPRTLSTQSATTVSLTTLSRLVARSPHTSVTSRIPTAARKPRPVFGELSGNVSLPPSTLTKVSINKPMAKVTSKPVIRPRTSVKKPPTLPRSSPTSSQSSAPTPRVIQHPSQSKDRLPRRSPSMVIDDNVTQLLNVQLPDMTFDEWEDTRTFAFRFDKQITDATTQEHLLTPKATQDTRINDPLLISTTPSSTRRHPISRLPTPPSSQGSPPSPPARSTLSSRIRPRPTATPPRPRASISGIPVPTEDTQEGLWEFSVPLQPSDGPSPNPRRKKSPKLQHHDFDYSWRLPSPVYPDIKEIILTPQPRPTKKGRGRMSLHTPATTLSQSTSSQSKSRKGKGKDVVKQAPATVPVNRRKSLKTPAHRARSSTPATARIRGMTPVQKKALNGRQLGVLPTVVPCTPGDDELLLRPRASRRSKNLSIDPTPRARVVSLVRPTSTSPQAHSHDHLASRSVSSSFSSEPTRDVRDLEMTRNNPEETNGEIGDDHDNTHDDLDFGAGWASDSDAHSDSAPDDTFYHHRDPGTTNQLATSLRAKSPLHQGILPSEVGADVDDITVEHLRPPSAMAAVSPARERSEWAGTREEMERPDEPFVDLDISHQSSDYALEHSFSSDSTDRGSCDAQDKEADITIEIDGGAWDPSPPTSPIFPLQDIARAETPSSLKPNEQIGPQSLTEEESNLPVDPLVPNTNGDVTEESSELGEESEGDVTAEVNSTEWDTSPSPRLVDVPSNLTTDSTSVIETIHTSNSSEPVDEGAKHMMKEHDDPHVSSIDIPTSPIILRVDIHNSPTLPVLSTSSIVDSAHVEVTRDHRGLSRVLPQEDGERAEDWHSQPEEIQSISPQSPFTELNPVGQTILEGSPPITSTPVRVTDFSFPSPRKEGSTISFHVEKDTQLLLDEMDHKEADLTDEAISDDWNTSHPSTPRLGLIRSPSSHNPSSSSSSVLRSPAQLLPPSKSASPILISSGERSYPDRYKVSKSPFGWKPIFPRSPRLEMATRTIHISPPSELVGQSGEKLQELMFSDSAETQVIGQEGGGENSVVPDRVIEDLRLDPAIKVHQGSQNPYAKQESGRLDRVRRRSKGPLPGQGTSASVLDVGSMPSEKERSIFPVQREKEMQLEDLIDVRALTEELGYEDKSQGKKDEEYGDSVLEEHDETEVAHLHEYQAVVDPVLSDPDKRNLVLEKKEHVDLDDQSRSAETVVLGVKEDVQVADTSPIEAAIPIPNGHLDEVAIESTRTQSTEISHDFVSPLSPMNKFDTPEDDCASQPEEKVDESVGDVTLDGEAGEWDEDSDAVFGTPAFYDQEVPVHFEPVQPVSKTHSPAFSPRLVSTHSPLLRPQHLNGPCFHHDGDYTREIEEKQAVSPQPLNDSMNEEVTPIEPDEGLDREGESSIEEESEMSIQEDQSSFAHSLNDQMENGVIIEADGVVLKHEHDEETSSTTDEETSNEEESEASMEEDEGVTMNEGEMSHGEEQFSETERDKDLGADKESSSSEREEQSETLILRLIQHPPIKIEPELIESGESVLSPQSPRRSARLSTPVPQMAISPHPASERTLRPPPDVTLATSPPDTSPAKSVWKSSGIQSPLASPRSKQAAGTIHSPVASPRPEGNASGDLRSVASPRSRRQAESFHSSISSTHVKQTAEIVRSPVKGKTTLRQAPPSPALTQKTTPSPILAQHASSPVVSTGMTIENNSRTSSLIDTVTSNTETAPPPPSSTPVGPMSKSPRLPSQTRAQLSLGESTDFSVPPEIAAENSNKSPLLPSTNAVPVTANPTTSVAPVSAGTTPTTPIPPKKDDRTSEGLQWMLTRRSFQTLPRHPSRLAHEVPLESPERPISAQQSHSQQSDNAQAGSSRHSSQETANELGLDIFHRGNSGQSIRVRKDNLGMQVGDERSDRVENEMDRSIDSLMEVDEADRSVRLLGPTRSLLQELSMRDEKSKSVVEVSSLDPKAAARAAAILKLNHAYIEHGHTPKGDKTPRADKSELLLEAELDLISLRRSRSRSAAPSTRTIDSTDSVQYGGMGHSDSPISSKGGDGGNIDSPYLPGGWIRTPGTKRKRGMSVSPTKAGPGPSRLSSGDTSDFTERRGETSVRRRDRKGKGKDKERVWGVTEWKKLEKVYRTEREEWTKERNVKPLPSKLGLFSWSGTQSKAEAREWDGGRVVDRFLKEEGRVAEGEWSRDLIKLRVDALTRRVEAKIMQEENFNPKRRRQDPSGSTSHVDSAKPNEKTDVRKSHGQRDDVSEEDTTIIHERSDLIPPSTIRRMIDYAFSFSKKQGGVIHSTPYLSSQKSVGTGQQDVSVLSAFDGQGDLSLLSTFSGGYEKSTREGGLLGRLKAVGTKGTLSSSSNPSSSLPLAPLRPVDSTPQPVLPPSTSTTTTITHLPGTYTSNAVSSTIIKPVSEVGSQNQMKQISSSSIIKPSQPPAHPSSPKWKGVSSLLTSTRPVSDPTNLMNHSNSQPTSTNSTHTPITPNSQTSHIYPTLPSSDQSFTPTNKRLYPTLNPPMSARSTALSKLFDKPVHTPEKDAGEKVVGIPIPISGSKRPKVSELVRSFEKEGLLSNMVKGAELRRVQSGRE